MIHRFKLVIEDSNIYPFFASCSIYDNNEFETAFNLTEIEDKRSKKGLIKNV